MGPVIRLQHGLAAASRRPVLATAVLAGLARLAFALLSFAVNPVYLIPDETQYMDLASTVASGRTAEDWYPNYGQSLYNSVRAFIAPLRLLFDVFGDSRIVGQLWSAAWGVVAATLVVVLARRVLDGRWALAVGVLVALLPSQVLWSSVVLRESMIWAGVVAAAVGAAILCRRTGWGIVAGAGIAAAGLLIVGSLRDQTMLAGTVALPIGVLLGTSGRRVEKVGAALLIALLVPWVSGTGPGGYDLVAAEFPALAKTRAKMSVDAASGFGATTVPPATTTTAAPAAPDSTTTIPPVIVTQREDGAMVIQHADGETEVVEVGDTLVTSDDQSVQEVQSDDGESNEVDDGPDSTQPGTSEPSSPSTTGASEPSSSTTAPPSTTSTTAAGDDADTDTHVFGEGDQLVAAPDGSVHVVEEGESVVYTPGGHIQVIAEGYSAIADRRGTVYVFESGGESNLRGLPTGAVAVLLRPFIWESTSSTPLRLASFENVIWYPLYVLAAIGAVIGWRRHRSAIAYPVLVTLTILGVAFLTQGNIGTSFRHRGQILPFLAILAGLGAQWLWERRRATGASAP